MRACCTIITSDYIHYAQALHKSLQQNTKSDLTFYVLIADSRDNVILPANLDQGIKILFVEDVCNTDIGKALKVKYYIGFINYFRWSIKSVLLSELINRGYEKVLFLDGDLFFFNEIDFLFELLDETRFLLTPHWRTSDPYKDAVNFQLLFNSGLFNAGFIGVNKDAVEILNWLSEVCLFKCEINSAIGNFGDQTYLNLIPVKFEGVEIIRNQGCNIANWNLIECKRISQPDGSVLINNKYPVTFIHFTESTITGILNDEDKELLPYLLKYKEDLQIFKPDFDIINKYNSSKTNPDLVKTNDKWKSHINRIKQIVKKI
jgi:lipopolysaccharide biosynthesis glycosyltransferase